MALFNQRRLLGGISGRPALFRPLSGQTRLVSAGMPGPMLLRGKDCQALQFSVIPPGLFPELDYEPGRFKGSPGFAVVLHGWLNRRSQSLDEEFDAEGLQEVCSQHAQESRLELLVPNLLGD
jgi:hypothetical protein